MEGIDEAFTSQSLDQMLEESLGNFYEEGTDWPVLLIDSDTLAYRAAAVTDGRQYIIGKTAFKYKSDVVKYCKDNNLDVEDIEEEYYPEPKKNAIKIVSISIHKIIEYGKSQFPDFNMEFFHSGPNKENYRMEFMPQYKANRIGKRKPHWLLPLKEYISHRYHEVSKTGYEADDLIGIRAYELQKQGIDYIIVTNDKDLKTIPGKHYDWTTGDELVSDKYEAMKYFYAQCIGGDTTDNIPGVVGLAVNKKGTGKAQKIIQKAYEEFREGLTSEWCNSFDTEVEFEYAVSGLLEEHLFDTAVDAWLEGGPGKNGSYGCESYSQILDKFLASAKCLFIRHHEDWGYNIPLCDWRNF